MGRVICRRPGRHRPRLGLWAAAAAAGTALFSVGCVSKVTMSRADGDDGARPHAVILYSGVRDSSRQYADYTVVDASILED